MAGRQLCMECHERPKVIGRHRCVICLDRQADITTRIRHAQHRASFVPAEMRRMRVPAKDWPAGRRWCASCQSFVLLEDVPKGGSRCKPCASFATHSARLEKVYGIDSTRYDELLRLQGGKCGICRRKPGTSKRLAVDHDHKTGVVRGLLCGRCNHELLGAGYDSPSQTHAATMYLLASPNSGLWTPPEQIPLPVPPGLEKTPSNASGFVTASESAKAPGKSGTRKPANDPSAYRGEAITKLTPAELWELSNAITRSGIKLVYTEPPPF